MFHCGPVRRVEPISISNLYGRACMLSRDCFEQLQLPFIRNYITMPNPITSLRPVLRHMTLPPSSSVTKATFASPKLCQLNPKTQLPDGKVPGMFHNLFVTDIPKPDVATGDLSETPIGRKCLVAPGGANFRYVTIQSATVRLIEIQGD
jgi:hypothetical protein